jgi:hypothetical protein
VKLSPSVTLCASLCKLCSLYGREYRYICFFKYKVLGYFLSTLLWGSRSCWIRILTLGTGSGI